MVQQLTQDSKSAGAAQLCRFAVANVRAGSCRLLRRLTPPSPAFLPVKGRTPFSGEGGNVSVEALWGTGLMWSRFLSGSNLSGLLTSGPDVFCFT